MKFLKKGSLLASPSRTFNINRTLVKDATFYLKIQPFFLVYISRLGVCSIYTHPNQCAYIQRASI